MSGVHDPRRNPHAVQEAEAGEQRRRIVRSAMEGLSFKTAALTLAAGLAEHPVELQMAFSPAG